MQYGITYSQQIDYLPFEIEGSIDADTGYIYLKTYFQTGYYQEDIKEIKAEIRNRAFSLNGMLPYPLGFSLSYGEHYLSDLFVIEPGHQTVKCHIDSVWDIPEINNQPMHEYETEFISAFKSISEKRKDYRQRWNNSSRFYDGDIPADSELLFDRELKSLYVTSDSTLLQYVSTHPDSYLALWRLVEKFTFGYEPIFDSIFEQFSSSIQDTYTGQALKKNLKIAGVIAPGKKFPPISIKDTHEKEFDFNAFSDKEYVLLDFWYSNCGPCIAQFTHLNNLYQAYKEKGFEIIGISTDRSKYKNNWLRAIEKYQLQWPQFWDMDGIESSKLLINVFPTTILLDSDGTIISKHIRPAELEQFLEENLK